MEVDPRIHRLGEEIVNSYLVEDGGEIRIVDAGVGPGLELGTPAAVAAVRAAETERTLG